MYKEAQRHRAVLPAVARQLFIALRCNSCPCAGYVSIRRRARPCGTVPRRADVSRPGKLLALSSSMSQRLGFEARSCYCMSFRRRARLCAAVRAHAPQFASMRFNARPCVFQWDPFSSYQITTNVKINR